MNAYSYTVSAMIRLAFQWAKIKRLKRDRENLPIAAFRQQLLNELSRQQVLVIAGDTGCGKSTQVPQYLAEEKISPADPESDPKYKRIAVTQPRKIACVSLAARVSTEMLCEKGTKVGYQVCFDACCMDTCFHRIYIIIFNHGFICPQNITILHLEVTFKLFELMILSLKTKGTLLHLF